MSVQTPFEETGSWTTIAREAEFLGELNGVGGLTVVDAGRSVQDRPIWQCSIGTGSTVLIGSLQHAPEPATRESSFALLRDLAYRTESWMDSFLASHRVIVFPTLNPDGRVLGTRNNANGVNLNRDWIRLTQPEVRVAQLAIAAADPDIVMDAHETSGQPGADWRPYPAGYPGEGAALRSLAGDFVTSTEPKFTAQGWSTLLYPINLLPFAGMSTAAGAQHRVGILTETVSVDIPATQRVNISLQTYRELLLWYQENRSAVQAARQAAATQAVEPRFRTVVPNREYVRSDPPSITTATGYVPTGPVPQYLLDAFGIQVVGGVIPVNQPARLLVTALCDPLSSERVIDATPIYDTPPQVDRVSGSVVDRGGVRYPVQQIITQQGGVRYPVQQIIGQQDGTRYPL